MTRKKLWTVALFAVLAIPVFYFASGTLQFFEVDRCLDSGGRWSGDKCEGAENVHVDTLMFPTPPNAESAQHLVIAPGAEQDYFWITATYPATPALPHYETIFAAWTQCKPWSAGWEGYGDLTKGERRYVHRFTRNWISRDNKQAVVLLFRYESSGSGSVKVPDNNRQLVSVMNYRVPDATAYFGTINVTCPK